ncbi:MAG: nucleotidyltransferase family protein [Candidatus Omnitrophica bacterium]|nr:nucleotidyltransferase family protein [Candidatus Omnitrophota bacterium]
MKKEWKKILVSPSVRIRQVIRVIDEGTFQIALVVDKNLRLLGTVTDGDARRGILRGISLEDKVERIMNLDPVTARTGEDKGALLDRMRLKQILQIPLLDEKGRVAGMELLDELVRPQKMKNWAVLMAGGLGSRLRPLTDNCPKPLLQVGRKPLLETILGNFIEYGFRRFYFSVRYKDEMVKNYFGDGSRWGVEIRYLRENDRLGTAGGLGLIREKPERPLIVMNGDLLTKVNFRRLLDFHAEQKAVGTLCIREYDFQVPYGVVRINSHHGVREIDEKPIQRFFISAGIYVIEPSVLSLIPKGRAMDMPHLFQKLISRKKEVAAFPIREYWLDIGRMDDLKRAQNDYAEVFGP